MPAQLTHRTRQASAVCSHSSNPDVWTTCLDLPGRVLPKILSDEVGAGAAVLGKHPYRSRAVHSDERVARLDGLGGLDAPQSLEISQLQAVPIHPCMERTQATGWASSAGLIFEGDETIHSCIAYRGTTGEAGRAASLLWQMSWRPLI